MANYDQKEYLKRIISDAVQGKVQESGYFVNDEQTGEQYKNAPPNKGGAYKYLIIYRQGLFLAKHSQHPALYRNRLFRSFLPHDPGFSQQDP